ncbi:MAG: hypothetical protein ACKVVP_14660 [Chloroflexota bacterium]
MLRAPDDAAVGATLLPPQVIELLEVGSIVRHQRSIFSQGLFELFLV